METSTLLAGLDAEQRRAVIDPRGPLCILAGAGSGKTRVLTRRVAYRANEAAADPRFVLALTFTRKAASEMGTRLLKLGLRDQPTVGTFHAVAWAQLRSWYRDNDKRPPNLLTNRHRLLGEIAGKGLSLSELSAEMDWSRAQDLTPDAYPTAAVKADRRASNVEALSEAMKRFGELKARRGVVDFDDLLDRCARLTVQDPRFSTAQHWRFRHVYVDEFQDVNPLQMRLLKAWLGGRNDLCVVGDPNQAIYAWNGADASYIRNFTSHFPGAATTELTTNYRSRPQILHVASAVIPSALMKPSRPTGDTPKVSSHESEQAEAAAIAVACRTIHGPMQRWNSQAILVRTNNQMPVLEEALSRARIPFRVRGGTPLLARNDVRDALRSVSWDVLRPLAMAITDLSTLADEATNTSPDLAEALESILRLAHELQRSDPSASAGDLRGWLSASMGSDAFGTDVDAVDLITFHAAKGLEWPVVHLAGIEDGLVPISHARTPEAKAEERRLLYVAVTRAGDDLRINWARSRGGRSGTLQREQSPYLIDIQRALAGAVTHGSPKAQQVGLAAARAALESAPRESTELLGALRVWRAEVARGAAVSPQVILSDRTLSYIARCKPEGIDDLCDIPGIGEMIAEAHGTALLEVVRSHP